jgi:hypothetical protein
MPAVLKLGAQVLIPARELSSATTQQGRAIYALSK